MAARSSSKTSKTSTTSSTDAIVAAVLAALQGQAAPKSAPKGKGKGTTERTYDLSKPATRSQVYRAFFAMAKVHHGLTFKSDEWPTSGDIQTILDSLA